MVVVLKQSMIEKIAIADMSRHIFVSVLPAIKLLTAGEASIP